MENTAPGEDAAEAASQRGAEPCSEASVEESGDERLQSAVVAAGEVPRSAKCEVKETVRELLERFGLSREDLVSAYDECVQERGGQVRVEKNCLDEAAAVGVAAAAQAAAGSELGGKTAVEQLPNDGGESLTDATCGGRQLQAAANGPATPSKPEVVEAMETEEEEQEEEEEEEDDDEESQRVENGQGNGKLARTEQLCRRNGTLLHQRSVGVGVCKTSSPLEEKEEVDKMQCLVQSALRVYEASSMQSELGQKRRCHFTLEDELTLQPSSFAQELLDRDQTVVAQAIKKYMNQYSVPQREVVEKTGLNQSHLSQHFLHGVTMKRSKRVKLYHWFEDDQKIRTGKPSTADSALNSVLESPKVEGSRRRPRWKWSPISTQILTEAFKKNHFPTREQRVELARVCNEAELTMNNGSPIRGPEGDTEGITEQRVNTWFTNRRKGLSTPSPTRGGLSVSHHGTTIFPHNLPPLLRAATPTTPTQSYSHTQEPEQNEDRPYSSPTTAVPAAVQTLVSHVQHVQSAASSGSAVQLAGTPTAAAQALPLTAITLPRASSTMLAAGTPLAALPQTSLAPPPLQTFAITPDGIPAALIPPSQLQAILSQVQVSNDSGVPTQIQLANTSGGIFTIPMLQTQKMTAAPSQIQTYAVAPASSAAIKSPATVSSVSPLSSSPPPSTYPSPTLTALPTFSQAPVHASVPTIIGSNQVQALLTTLQAQAKLQGLPHVQFSHTNPLPLTIAMPGGGGGTHGSDDIIRAQALLVNHQGPND